MWMSFTALTAYRLVEIEDETVPLAAAAGQESVFPLVEIMLMAVLVLGAAFYILECCRYKARIRELAAGDGTEKGWKLWSLKSRAREIELRRQDEALRGLEPGQQPDK